MQRRIFLGGLLSMAPSQSDHERFMRLAIAAASHNKRAPFGAVIVSWEGGEVMAEGWNKSRENPTWHGEIDAINRCATAHPGIDWKKLALYTTAEPCPMCQSAIVWSGMKLMVYGTSIPTLKRLGWGQIDLRASEISAKAPFNPCEVVGGILEKECDSLFVR
jgi:tRNA(Arg) A34 adenosine deaminase TadA